MTLTQIARTAGLTPVCASWLAPNLTVWEEELFPDGTDARPKPRLQGQLGQTRTARVSGLCG